MVCFYGKKVLPLMYELKWSSVRWKLLNNFCSVFLFQKSEDRRLTRWKKIAIIDMSQNQCAVYSNGQNEKEPIDLHLLNHASPWTFGFVCSSCSPIIRMRFTLSCKRIHKFVFSLFKIVQNQIKPFQCIFLAFHFRQPAFSWSRLRESSWWCAIETIHEIEQYSLSRNNIITVLAMLMMISFNV